METEREQRFKRWLRSQQFDHEVTGGKTLERLDLVHAGSKRDEVLYGLSVKDTGMDESALCSTLLSYADDDAAELGGVQNYRVFAYYKGSKKPSNPFRFRVHAPDPGFASGGDNGSESPDTKGVTSMLMRHQEALFKSTMGGFATILTHAQRQIDSTARRAETAEAKLAEMFEVYQRLMTMDHEREMQAYTTHKREERFDEMAHTFKQIGPGLINRLTGSNIFEGAKDPAILGLKQTLESLSADQFEAIVKVLKPEQSIQLIELQKQLLDYEEAHKKLPNGSGETH